MNKRIFRALALAVSVCALAFVAAGQQPSKPRRGGLDNLSLPSTSARVSSATTTAGAGGTWMTFAPEGAGFSISLPGLPDEGTPAGSERGQLNPQFRIYRLAAGGLKYEVARTPPLPAQLVSQPNFADKFFATSSDNLTRALQAENPTLKFQLVAEQTISLDGYEGRELEFAAPGHRAIARVFLIERAFFALGVLGAKSDMTPDKVNRFLNSLALTQ